MEPKSQSLLPPYEEANEGPSKDILKPAVLVLAGQSIVSETATATPLYQMNWSVTSIPQKDSSVVFERVEHVQAEKVEGTAPGKQQNRHLFYLAHPAGAQFLTDNPAYYITSVVSEMLGNISLEVCKSRFQKSEFKALLSAKKSMSASPLFDENAQPLFDVKLNWMGRRYTWTDSQSQQVAYEDGKVRPHKLVVTASMERAMRDALVATWCLRLWHDTAESRQARREGRLGSATDRLVDRDLASLTNCLSALQRWTPPESMRGYGNMKMAKRAGALGSLAGAGAGAC